MLLNKNLTLLLVISINLLSQVLASPCPPNRKNSQLVSHAENSLGAALPVSVFCVYGRPDNGVVWLFSIQAYEKLTGRYLGELLYPIEIKEGLGLFSLAEIDGSVPHSPKLVDPNFDGYLDVSLLSFVGSMSNAGSNIWLFNPDQKWFIYEKVMIGHNLKVDPVSQVLTSGWKGGVQEQTTVSLPSVG